MMAVKKSVKSRKDLDRMALAKGATVTDAGGKTFNTAKKKSAVKRMRPAPKTPEAPKPAPDKGSEMLAAKVEEASAAHLKMMDELKMQIAQIQLNAPEPPTEWVFDMVRDDKGYLKQIKATASYGRRTVN